MGNLSNADAVMESVLSGIGYVTNEVLKIKDNMKPGEDMYSAKLLSSKDAEALKALMFLSKAFEEFIYTEKLSITVDRIRSRVTVDRYESIARFGGDATNYATTVMGMAMIEMVDTFNRIYL